MKQVLAIPHIVPSVQRMGNYTGKIPPHSQASEIPEEERCPTFAPLFPEVGGGEGYVLDFNLCVSDITQPEYQKRAKRITRSGLDQILVEALFLSSCLFIPIL